MRKKLTIIGNKFNVTEIENKQERICRLCEVKVSDCFCPIRWLGTRKPK